MGSFLELLTEAAKIVEHAYAGSLFCRAEGKPSIGFASREEDVDMWRFIFLGPDPSQGMKSVFLNYQSGRFDSPVLKDEPPLGDHVIKLPIKMGLAQAIDLKSKAGFSEPFLTVILLWPLTPSNDEPFFIFRATSSGAHVFVGTVSGQVAQGA